MGDEFLDEIESVIESGEASILDAFKKIKQEYSSNDLVCSACTLRIGQWHDVQTAHSKGTLSEADYEVQKARIRDAALSLARLGHQEVDDDPGRYQEVLEGAEKLIPFAAIHLRKSEETRKYILLHNGLDSSVSAVELAEKIILADEPMAFLVNCLRISDEKSDDLKRGMFHLAEILAPICLTINEVDQLRSYMASPDSSHGKLGTKSSWVATSAVGRILGVPIGVASNGQECLFMELDKSFQPQGRNRAAAFAAPPELGIDSSKGEAKKQDIVSVVTSELYRLLDAYSESVGAVRAKLEYHKKSFNLHYCILFLQSPGDHELKRLHEEFPDLLLLVSIPQEEENWLILSQMKDVFDEFRPETTK
ncbi:MAG: hypothetical protein R3C18_06900 [Planctomycetaceae bacterium]